MTAVEVEIMEILTASRSEMTGMEIVKASEKAGGTVQIVGTAYVYLRQLEEAGYVTSREGPEEPIDGPRQGRRKRFYKATQSGRAELRRRNDPTGDLAPA